ncbi:hypothetical protein DFP72DRAFT_848860 [Ephemerocybe angulata]|uniref:Uncharacterized protein n=1 Tax=Ephemerocybe angulata TaxID=980116 RepID=A0A8H6HVF1_9AGAR|nr:hypothetical protein DFP72DRAFT_848860 [Tulosesus angulatus]
MVGKEINLPGVVGRERGLESVVGANRMVLALASYGRKGGPERVGGRRMVIPGVVGHKGRARASGGAKDSAVQRLWTRRRAGARWWAKDGAPGVVGREGGPERGGGQRMVLPGVVGREGGSDYGGGRSVFGRKGGPERGGGRRMVLPGIVGHEGGPECGGRRRYGPPGVVGRDGGLESGGGRRIELPGVVGRTGALESDVVVLEEAELEWPKGIPASRARYPPAVLTAVRDSLRNLTFDNHINPAPTQTLPARIQKTPRPSTLHAQTLALHPTMVSSSVVHLTPLVHPRQHSLGGSELCYEKYWVSPAISEHP